MRAMNTHANAEAQFAMAGHLDKDRTALVVTLLFISHDDFGCSS